MDKLRTEFTSPIAKSTSLRLSDTAFFARCKLFNIQVGSFLFSQINLGINDFQMLMMVVNDNLLEGEHGKLDVSNNSLRRPGGGILPYMVYTGIRQWTGYGF